MELKPSQKETEIVPKKENLESVEDSTSEEIEKEKTLEKCLFLEERDRVFLLLILRGLKTASAVSVPVDFSEKNMENFKNTVEQAGLFFKSTKGAEGFIYERMRGLRSGRICFVANNQKDLESISKLWFGDHEKNPDVYKEIGRMSGYPLSSIATYDKFARLPEPEREEKKNELVLSEEEKKNLFSPELFFFAKFFYMSRNNWEVELETVKKWAEEIKLTAPDLYKKIINANQI